LTKKCLYKISISQENPYGCSYNGNQQSGVSPLPKCGYPVTIDKVKKCASNDSTSTPSSANQNKNE
jgi:hypothetical protein